MNSADYVTNQINSMKSSGMPLQEVAWNAALLSVGWPYVFGARWNYCTPEMRRHFYSEEHPTIKSACKNYYGNGNEKCAGCKWYPEQHLTRINDCRGFTYGILDAVYGWELEGGGCTSQWNKESNWSAKGTISTIPDDILVCLFVQNGAKMEHTGFGFRGQTVECSSGVQYFEKRKSKWTHWAIPKCVNAEPIPVPAGYAIVTGKNVALRKDPSLQATIIMRIKTGETVKLEDLPPKEWDYVSYKGTSGWMMRAYLREEGNVAIVTGKRVALRKDPSLRATIYMRINTGETVNLEPEPESAWDYVSYGSNKGYMMKEFLREGDAG